MTMLTLTAIPSRRATTLPCAADAEAWYDPDQETTAKAGCARCPVRDMCLTVAVESDEPWGVWGGYTPIERQRLAAGRKPRNCAGCGQLCVPWRQGIARCDPCTGQNATRRADDDRDTIARLAESGVTDPDIAARLGWKVWQVKECRKKYGITSCLPNGGGLRRSPADLAPCGTGAAYRRHKRRGEPVDEACAQANRLEWVDKEKRLKQRRQAAATST